MPALNAAKEAFAYANLETPRADFSAVYEWIRPKGE
jgi:hypothetical protein